MPVHDLRIRYMLGAVLLALLLCASCLGESIEVSVEFPVEKLSITQVNGFDAVSYPGCFVTSEPGAPALPQKAVYVSIPANSEVDYMEITGYSKNVLTGEFTVYPAQPLVPIELGNEPEFVGPDEAYYETDSPYPSEIAVCTDSGYLSGYNIAGLIVTPFEYRPMSKTLSLIVSISISLHLTPCQPSALASYQRSEIVRTACEDRVKRLVTNSDSVYPTASFLAPMASFDTVDCVIITGGSTVDEMEPLCDWMIERGYRTEVHSVSSIAGSYGGQDTAEDIRNFIKSYYSSKGLGWVVLGGDTSVVPTRIAYAFDCDGDGFDNVDYQQCDYYYADLDGTWNDDGDSLWGEVSPDNIDMYADVIVGRLPFDTESEATTIANKVLMYEGASGGLSADYQKKLLMFACKLDDTTWGGDCLDAMESYVGIPGDWTIAKRYDRDSTSGRSNVISSLNSGYNLISNMGHANYSVMSAKYVGSAEYLYRDDMSGLSNASRPGILHSGGCWAAAMDYDCIGERFVLAPNGGGIAFIGNSRYGWFSPGYPGSGPNDAYSQEFFSSIFDYGTCRLGEAFSDSKQAFVSYAKASYSSSPYYRWVLYGMNLLGPPTTPVWTNTPAEISTSYDSRFLIGQDEFEVYAESGSALQSALVCLYKEDEVFETGQTGADGWATISVSPSATSTGTMHITVTKQDHLPFRGTVPVEEDTSNSDPVLTDGSVGPQLGQSGATFSYCVHYYDEDEDSPDTAFVYIDGNPNAMTLSAGEASDGDYEYETSSLSEGLHSYYFYFEDGHSGSCRLPSSGTSSGPRVDGSDPTSSCSISDYSKTQSITLNFTSSDGGSGILETKLYYKFESGSWTFTNETEAGDSGQFSFSLPAGEGAYYFYTLATDEAGNEEDTKTSADDSTTYDCTRPSSSCSSPNYGTSTINVSFNASDGGGTGLSSTKLYYKFGSGSYVYSGSQSSSSSGSFSFGCPSGEGTYSFYTISTDRADNEEQAPTSPDSITIYDASRPSSSCSSPASTNSSPIAVSFSSSDSITGVSYTKLYYRFNSGSYTYSGLSEEGETGSFSFTANEGDGTYDFYTVATDDAGNQETPPYGPDDSTAYDCTAPVSSCSAPEIAYESPITVEFTASDDGSGLSTTKLYYREDGGEYTDSGLQDSGDSGTYEFDPPSQTGVYDFYTLSEDEAGNTEDAPSSPDATTDFDETDSTRPESYCTAPEYAKDIPIDVDFFASDDQSGVDETKLYYSFNGGEYQDSGVSNFGATLAPPPLGIMYASPDGSPEALGTALDPKSIESIIEDPDLAPGTLVVLRGGTYSLDLCQPGSQDGTSDHPIVYTTYGNERVIIDGSITVNGNNTTIHGIEITNTGAFVTSGIQVGGGDDVKIVNCIIHDLANHSNGIGGWSVGSGHVFYGNNIWGMAPDAGDPHGHGIYSQNEEVHGLKIIKHNIIHNNGKMSMQLGASAKDTYGYRITENTVFKNARYLLCGSSGDYNKRTYNNIIRGNLLYSPATGGYGDKISLGYTGGVCDDNEVSDNYIIGGDATRFLTTGLRNIITHNTFCDRQWSYATLWGSVQHDPPDPSNTMNNNVYYHINVWGDIYIRFTHPVGGIEDYSLVDWRAFSGFDLDSTDAGSQLPTENK
ncbi:hypothetical protein J7M28_12115, partial [bacterium]|nr:hypothetical protein [bacterium]